VNGYVVILREVAESILYKGWTLTSRRVTKLHADCTSPNLIKGKGRKNPRPLCSLQTFLSFIPPNIPHYQLFKGVGRGGGMLSLKSIPLPSIYTAKKLLG
jgi:hypothetical protein